MQRHEQLACSIRLLIFCALMSFLSFAAGCSTEDGGDPPDSAPHVVRNSAVSQPPAEGSVGSTPERSSAPASSAPATVANEQPEHTSLPSSNAAAEKTSAAGMHLTVVELERVLDGLPDGTPVTVSGVVGDFSEITRGPQLHLLTPAPLSFQKLLHFYTTCRFSSTDDFAGLVAEQPVVIEAVVENTERRTRSGRYVIRKIGLRDCRIVSRGEVPEFAPVPPDWKAIEDSPEENVKVEGVLISRFEGGLGFEEPAIAEDGSLPQHVVDAVARDLQLHQVVISDPIQNTALKQLATLQGMHQLRLLDQGTEREDDTTDRPGANGLNLALLAQSPRLRWMLLETDTLTGENLRQLSTLRCLSELSVEGDYLWDGCDLSGIDDAAIRELAPLKSLRSLIFAEDRKGQPTKITDDGLSAFAELPRLTILDLWSDSIDGSGFAALGTCPNFWSLRLSKCPVTSEGLQSLSQIPSLLAVDLSETDVDSGIGPTLKSLPNLTMVDLEGTKVDDQLAPNLAGHPTLRSLKLNGTGVTDETLRVIAENPPPRLRNLLVERTAVTDAGVKLLANIKTLELLTADGISDAVRESVKQAIPGLQFYAD